MKFLKKFLIVIFSTMQKIINKIISYLSKSDDMKLQILNVDFDKSGRFLSFYLQNNYLYDNHDALQAIFNTLMSDIRFTSFGNNKVIITTAFINGTDFSFHHNVLITNNTTFIEYYDKIKTLPLGVEENYEDGYPVNVIPTFKVRV
jgi:hypothetical protein